MNDPSEQNKPAEDAGFEGLFPEQPTQRDLQIETLQEQLAYEKDARREERFVGIVICFITSPEPSGSVCCNYVPVGGGRDADGVLDHAGKAVRRALGGAAIEAEDVLAEIGLKVLGADGTVVRAQEPALDQAEDEMDGGQALVGLAPGAGELDDVMGVAGGLEPVVAAPTVGGDAGGRGDVGREERFEMRARRRGDDLEPQPAEPALLGLARCRLDRAGDDGLAGGTPAALAGLAAADEGLVGLDVAAERAAIRIDHGAADLLQPGPGRAVAAKAQLPLQLQRRDPALAGGHQVDREKPARQAGLGLLEDGAFEDRMLLAAGAAFLDQPPVMAPRRVMTATGAAKAVRPAGPDQVGPALRVSAETRQKARHVPRQVLQQLVGHGALQKCFSFVLYGFPPIPSTAETRQT